MKSWCRIFALIALLAPGVADAVSLQTFRSSLVKINVVYQAPNFKEPWADHAPRRASGTGFYIGNGLILTNAHVVANGKFITILRDGFDHTAEATPAFIGHDCDLAVLKVSDSQYLKDATPLELGGLPQLRRPVATIGYPAGGEQLSVTEGVVSRIDYRRYVHPAASSHLLVQVDSAINPGNSGGPVVQGRRVVGVAFQTNTGAENTGYIIPTPVIKRFLKDIADGRYDGHPDAGILVRPGALENPALRTYYGLPTSLNQGVPVRRVEPWAAASGAIEEGDILLSVARQPVGLDGKVAFQNERVSFRVMFDLRQIGDVVSVDVWRQGKRLTIQIPLKPAADHYDRNHVFTDKPRYFVYGGLVFTSLSLDFLETFGPKWYYAAPIALRYFHIFAGEEPRFSGAKDIIVLADRLPAAVNAYCGPEYQNQILDTVGGQPVKSLEELRTLVTNTAEPNIVLRFLDKTLAPLVLPKAAFDKENQAILAAYGLPDAASFDEPGLIPMEVQP